VILPASYSNGFTPRDGSPLYPELWRNCVGAWAPCLGPTGVTLRDWSGRSNHGALTNFTVSSAWQISGGRYAISCDGTDDFVNCGSTVPKPSNALTISMWFNRPASGDEVVFGQYDVSGTYAYLMEQFSDNKYYMSVSGNGTTTAFTVTAADTTYGEWTHLLATYSPAGISVYKNGQEMAGSTSGSPPSSIYASSSAPVRIGRYGSVYMSALVDDCRLYNAVLSQSQIRMLSLRRGIAYELAPPRRSSSAVVITSGFSALRPSILRGSR
jgi:hypothetical protein